MVHMIQVFILISFVIFSQSINKACNITNNTCPIHSSCNLNTDYCACDNYYIGDCSIEANLGQSSPNSYYTLNSQSIMLLYIEPISLNHQIQFSLTICQEMNFNEHLYLHFWIENGNIQNFNQKSAARKTQELKFQNQCVQFEIQGYFNKQINGLEMSNKTEKHQITVNIQINQRIPLQLYFTRYFLMAILVFVFVFFFIMMVVLILKKIRRNRNLMQTVQMARDGNNDNDIEYFQVYMKSVKAQKVGIINETCPVCLQLIQKNQLIRKTPCTHCFHNTCLDQWCKKNLSCPVCRNELTLQFLKAIKMSQKIQIINKNHYVKNWQQNIQIQLQNIQNNLRDKQQYQKNEIRQAILE